MDYVTNCDVCGLEHRFKSPVLLPVFCHSCRPKKPIKTGTPPKFERKPANEGPVCNHRGLKIGTVEGCGCGSGKDVYLCTLLKEPCMRQKPSKDWSEVTVDNPDIKEAPRGCHGCPFFMSGAARWVPVNEVPDPIISDRLLITVAIGEEALEIFSLTEPYLRAYARKCNAQFIVLKNRTQNWWGLEKFRVQHFSKFFERTLFLDCDLVVTADAPDLFDIVPEGYVALHDDWDRLTIRDFVEIDAKIFRETQSRPYLDARVFNSGVVLFDREHSNIWEPPPRPFGVTHTSEQAWVEQNIRHSKYPLYFLGEEWNNQYWFGEDFKQPSFVKHMASAGHAERIKFFSQWAKDHPIQPKDKQWGPIDLPAVTGVSKLPKHAEVQHRCFASWKRMGLTIFGATTEEDKGELCELYPEVDHWVVTEFTTVYSWATAKINALADIAVQLDKKIMLINSDIEIHGDQQVLIDAMNRDEVTVGIRHNFEKKWWYGEREPWGLDAFVMGPEHARSLPRLEFGIGRPMWDYWLPIHFKDCVYIGEPFFYHKSHPIHWSFDDWELGATWVKQHYGVEFTKESSIPWRRTLPFGPPPQHWEPIPTKTLSPVERPSLRPNSVPRKPLSSRYVQVHVERHRTQT